MLCTPGATYRAGGPHLPTASGAGLLFRACLRALGAAAPLGSFRGQGPGRQEEAAATTSGEPG